MGNRLGILVGASTIGNEESKLLDFLRQQDVYKIAVDGGISFFIKNNIVPDFWLGDMDSTREKSIENINKDSSFDLDDFLAKIKKKELSPIKDDTDMALAVEDAVANGCNEIAIFGGLGGARMSHTFANVQLVYRYAKKKINIKMYSETGILEVVVNGSLTFPKKDKGFVSIFALSDKAKGVSIKNLFYEYEGDLTNDVALGVSNEFCGKEASVSVADGALLVIYE